MPEAIKCLSLPKPRCATCFAKQPRVAKEFANKTPKSEIKRLPEHVKKKGK